MFMDMNKDLIVSPSICILLCFCFSGMQKIYFSLQRFGLSTKTCSNYLGPPKNSAHERPEREEGQAQGQHGAVEEAHHLGAAKVNSQHYSAHEIIMSAK